VFHRATAHASIEQMGTVPFQLAIQFPRELLAMFDATVAFKDRLIACMPKNCRVDGHDLGAGTINFFVYTSAPEAAQ